MPYRNNEYETHTCKTPECGQKWHWTFFTVTKTKKVGSGLTEVSNMEWDWRKC
jgi:hypothetical protein